VIRWKIRKRKKERKIKKQEKIRFGETLAFAGMTALLILFSGKIFLEKIRSPPLPLRERSSEARVRGIKKLNYCEAIPIYHPPLVGGSKYL